MMIKVICRARAQGGPGPLAAPPNARSPPPGSHRSPAAGLVVRGCAGRGAGTAAMGFYDNPSPRFPSIWHPLPGQDPRPIGLPVARAPWMAEEACGSMMPA